MSERSDTERLDWLNDACSLADTHGRDRWEVARIAGSPSNPHFIQLTIRPWGHDTLRQAIDAAMAAEEDSNG